MNSMLRLAVSLFAFTLVSATLVVAQQFDPFRPATAPLWQCDEEMHDYYIRRFESSDGFGLSRMPQPPMLDRTGRLQIGGKGYSIEQLELVGLRSSPEPVAYVPLRHNLSLKTTGFKSRPLTPFEQRALDALRKGRTIERSASAETVNVVGALRGDGSCLKCHTDVKEGELLGAFTYRLRRVVDRD